jgi:hypothetical protein
MYKYIKASDDEFMDTVDMISDNVEDIQDAVEDMDEDDIDIETDNNISNHYIAECERCHGIFISAMIESDQAVQKISGVCPLCDHETDQYLKWIIRDADIDDVDDESYINKTSDTEEDIDGE